MVAEDVRICSVYFSGVVSGRRIFIVFVDLWTVRGSILVVLGRICRYLFSVVFVDGFWGSGSGWLGGIGRSFGETGPWTGDQQLVEENVPGMRLSTIDPKPELTQCVYQHFLISGFPVSTRERLVTSSNLPLSEDVSEEYSGEAAGSCRGTTRLACRRHGGR